MLGSEVLGTSTKLQREFVVYLAGSRTGIEAPRGSGIAVPEVAALVVQESVLKLVLAAVVAAAVGVAPELPAQEVPEGVQEGFAGAAVEVAAGYVMGAVGRPLVTVVMV